LQTGPSSFTPGLSNVKAILWSDLLMHHMGTNLADGVSQGAAGPDEFSTSPLWGLGQRIFFLHDGRTTDLLDVIQQHASPGSEWNRVVKRFNRLTDSEKESQSDVGTVPESQRLAAERSWTKNRHLYSLPHGPM
jgi:CxxC motif-containing protein (DUF1111 family)